MNFNVGFPGDSAVENLPANAGDAAGTAGSVPGLGNCWGRKYQAILVLLLGKIPQILIFLFVYYRDKI